MQKLIILVGNIGLGKSTFARKLADEGAMVVNLDSIVTMLHGGNYKGYREDWKEVYKGAQIDIMQQAVISSLDIIIDNTNMKRKGRVRLISKFCQCVGGFTEKKIICYDFGSGTEEGLDRRMGTPYGHEPEYWKDVYKLKKEQYERPSLEEGFDETVDMRNVSVFPLTEEEYKWGF